MKVWLLKSAYDTYSGSVVLSVHKTEQGARDRISELKIEEPDDLYYVTESYLYE